MKRLIRHLALYEYTRGIEKAAIRLNVEAKMPKQSKNDFEIFPYCPRGIAELIAMHQDGRYHCPSHSNLK